VKFRYNDIDSVRRLFKGLPGQIACVMLEPVKFEPPQDNFLHELRTLCRKEGALFILDEIITGAKWDLGGAQRYFDLKADLSTWGKGIANGFSACVLSGRAEVMELGGIRRRGRPKLFLISTTNGAETGALAAMIATLRELRDKSIIPDNWERGAVLKTRLTEVIQTAGLGDFLRVDGYPCLLAVDILDHDRKPCLGYRTLLMQEMIARGILFQGIFYPTWSHQAPEIAATVAAFRDACVVYRQAIEARSYRPFLVGEPIKPVFRKYV
jgi:glutamate-1-semialdehyde 2,1-aminomutase